MQGWLIRTGLTIVSISSIACAQILGDDFEIARETSGGAGGMGGGQGGGGTAQVGGSGGTMMSSVSLTVMPPALRILRGASADVEVTLTRDGFDDAVDLQVLGLPDGVTTPPVTVPAGETVALVTLSVAANATLGPALFAIRGAGGIAAPVDVNLMVADPPGTLDESFDSDGLIIATLPSGTGNETGRSVAFTPEQDLLVGVSLDVNDGWALLRYDPVGMLRPGFIANAAAALPTTGRIASVTYDPVASKVVACGTSGASTLQATVVVLNDDGTADQSFSSDGIAALTSIDYPQGSLCSGVLVQADSKILFAGYETTTDPVGLAGRFDTDGSLDATFAGNGVFEDQSDTRKSSIMLAPGGGYIVAGREQSGTPVFDAIRLDADGVLDTTYGTSGRGTLGGGPHQSHEAVIEPDGHVFICGESISSPRAEIGRFTPTGQSSFDGIELGIHGNSDRFFGCAVQQNGMRLAAGYGSSAEAQEAYVARIDELGALDPSFGTDGVASISVNMSTLRPSFRDVAVQPDGRIVAVGNQATSGVLIARFWD